MAPIPKHIIEEAAQWYVNLQDGSPTHAEEGLKQWLGISIMHQQAWDRVTTVTQRFQAVPASIALPTLTHHGLQRRLALRSLVIASVTTGILGSAYRYTPWRSWTADLRTAVGEQQRYTLADNTVLHLNTDTAVDVRISENQREIQLYQGEVYIETAIQPQQPALQLRTPQAIITSDNAHFGVRVEKEVEVLQMYKHSAELRLVVLPEQHYTVHEGEAVRYTQNTVAGMVHNAEASAWLHGKLSVLDMPLAEFLAELSRYRAGFLSCDPAIANMLVSGVYPIRNTEETLAILQAVFHLRQQRYSSYWVRLQPLDT